jgi:pheromone shutdown protein TraB
MTDNYENEDDDLEDDGITININADSNTDNNENDQNVDETSEETTQEEFEEEFLRDDGTIVVDNNGGRVRLVGTVHVSKETRDRVQETVNEEQSDVVAIELDNDRLTEMFKRGADVVGGEVEDTSDGFGLRDLIRKQQQNQFDGDNVLQPGEADMIPAVEEGINIGSNIALIDMSVDELKSNVKDNAFDETGSLDLEILDKSFGELKQAVKSFAGSRSDLAEKAKEDGMGAVVEHMENASLDEVQEQMDPMRNLAPEVIEALIDERDMHMAGRLHWLRQNGYDVTAVMGRGHLQGVYNHLQNPDQIPEEYVTEPDFYQYSKVQIN